MSTFSVLLFFTGEEYCVVRVQDHVLALSALGLYFVKNLCPISMIDAIVVHRVF